MTDVNDKSKAITGTVVSTKMDKTITVLVERLIKHPVYGKYIRRSTKLLAHDERNACQKGDIVAIRSCRPYSKRKSWELLDIVETSEK